MLLEFILATAGLIHTKNGGINTECNGSELKRAFLQLHIEYSDGKKEIITTNEEWKWAHGPVLYNCIYDGEVYDAGHEISGWAQADFDDSGWTAVNVLQAPGGKLKSHIMPPVKITQIFEPINEFHPAPDVIVYDMGQNFAGSARVVLKGNKGTKLKMQFAEDIYD